jgi:hypothetical protein
MQKVLLLNIEFTGKKFISSTGLNPLLGSEFLYSLASFGKGYTNTFLFSKPKTLFLFLIFQKPLTNNSKHKTLFKYEPTKKHSSPIYHIKTLFFFCWGTSPRQGSSDPSL